MERRKFVMATAALGGVSLLAACGTMTTATNTIGANNNDPAQRRRTLDTNAGAAINRLYSAVPSSRELVSKARGVLVFPSVIAAGLGVGGQFGEGVLMTGGSSAGYYNLASLSVGLQAGAQSKAVYLLFMTQDALDKFRASQGWSAGVDASVALVNVGANGAIDINTIKAPVAAFVLTNAGLMANLTLEGTKITRLNGI
jgi:lipid-binding SYLF domain-containing protein